MMIEQLCDNAGGESAIAMSWNCRSLSRQTKLATAGIAIMRSA